MIRATIRFYRLPLIALLVFTIATSTGVFAWAAWQVATHQIVCMKYDINPCPPIDEHVGAKHVGGTP